VGREGGISAVHDMSPDPGNRGHSLASCAQKRISSRTWRQLFTLSPGNAILTMQALEVRSHSHATTTTVKQRLVVPASVQRRARIKAGDRLEFRVSGGVITILPKLPSADSEYTPEQRRIINARLAESEEDLKKGRTFGPFNTADEMIASMKRELKKRALAKRASRPR